ncbi:MAG: hypothetical protein OIF32_07445 [Campylobacterales bacterium]|nr:hypothetical protein [Campylobacterales bacterium]
MSNNIQLEFNNKIIDVKKFKDHLFFLDEKVHLHKYSLDFEKEQDYKVIKDKGNYTYQQLLKNGSLLFQQNEKLYTFTVKTKSFKEFFWIKENITSVAPSSDGKFIAVGYEDGSVSIFLVDGTLYQTISFHFGKIIALCFSETSNRLIINCERNKTVVHDINTNKTIGTILTKAPTFHSKFIDDNTIFCFDESGYTSIIDIKSQEVKSYRNNNIKGGTSIAITPDKEYGIIGSYDGTLTVIFLEINKILFSKKTQTSSIINIQWIEDTLLFMYEDNKVEVFTLGTLHQLVKNHIKNKNFSTVSKLLKENIFLTLFSDIEKELDDIWNETVFPEALDLIIDDKIDQAKKITLPFLHDEYKNKVFNIYIDKQDIPTKFDLSYETKDYVTFYQLAEQYPHFKRTKRFQLVENQWKITYEKAFKQIKDSLKDKAIETFKPFYEVEEKKHIISTLINIPKMFIDSQKEYQLKNFDEYYSIVGRAPVLKETPEFLTLEKITESLKEKMLQAEKEDNLKERILYGKKLGEFKPYKKLAQKHLNEVKEKVKFLDYMKKNEISLAYNIADESNDVTLLKEFQIDYKKYLDKEALCYKHIETGNTKEILKILREFFHIPFFKKKASSIIKLSYVNSLKHNTETKNLDWKATAENYGRLFGLDHNIEIMMRALGQEKEYYKASGGRSGTGYIRADFPQTIIQYKTQEQIQKEEEKKEAQEKGKYAYVRHIIIGLAIILSVIMGTLFLQDFFSNEIDNYNNNRKSGPFQFFNHAHEKFKQKGGDPEETQNKQEGFLNDTFGTRK